jgi:uncharacterized protein YhbP (UPF0306 family)
MRDMESTISNFIGRQKLMTLATVEDSEPYCASLFYAFLPDEKILVFKSNEESIHIRQARKNSLVAGTINLASANILKLQGIQFSGVFMELSSPEIFQLASARYMQKFPFAGIIKKADFWAISLNQIKMTDNSLGFGKKLFWKREEVVSVVLS